jgi:hypothetical protein
MWHHITQSNGKTHRAAALIAVLALSACAGDRVVGPDTTLSPHVVFSLTSAPTGLGALRVRVIGAGTAVPTARGTARIAAQRTVADTTTLILAVTATTGDVLELTLANAKLSPVLQVDEATAGRNGGYQALSAAQVSVKITRP